MGDIERKPADRLTIWMHHGKHATARKPQHADGWEQVEYVRADVHLGAVGILQTAVAELDDWRNKGSDVMRDENVDDFIAAAKAFLATDGGR